MNEYDYLPVETCIKLGIANYYTLGLIYLGMQIESGNNE